MKQILLVATCMVATVGALADGTIQYSNYATAAGVNVPIINSDTGLKIGAGYMSQLYAGATEASLAPTAITAPFLSTSAGAVTGYFNGGAKTITGAPDAASYWVAVAAFDSSGGKTSYADALAAGVAVGMSKPFQVNLGGKDPAGGPDKTPGFMTGLQPFTVAIVPEPTTIALGALAAGALFLFRRK